MLLPIWWVCVPNGCLLAIQTENKKLANYTKIWNKTPKGKTHSYFFFLPKTYTTCELSTSQCSDAYHREPYLTVNMSSLHCSLVARCIIIFPGETSFFIFSDLFLSLFLTSATKPWPRKHWKKYFLKWTWWEEKLQGWIMQGVGDKIQVFHR